MVRKVKISTFNFANASLDPDISMQEAVEQMKRFLEGRMKQVWPDRPDLLVLPEFCDMPHNYAKARLRDFYEARGNYIFDFLAETARRHRCYITYPSATACADGTWRNSVRLIDRDGKLAGTYHKNHPVITEIVDDGVLCGQDISVTDCDFGRVGVAICFDLNFDELRLKYKQARPDLIVFPSQYHGGIMQQYWAYSCRAHFVGSVSYRLPSAIISPVGHILAETTNYFDFVTGTVNLDCAVVHLDGHGGKLAAMKEKYGPKVNVTDPGLLGSVLISSETDECTTRDLIEEFQFEPLDDYFARSLSYHREARYIEPPDSKEDAE